ncbi:MAG: 3-oxoacyl-ACP synthase III [Deltaproteobacteria bacterium]|jgi:3-oxoacyl-[acyl-carrier-protein] synthase-3|nr:3-oxoacyl-ACP synthase III [Deltaproteobacteria bacterium]
MRNRPQFSRAALVGWARDEGPDRVDSDSLEGALRPVLDRLRLPAGLLASLTGIRSRLLYPAGRPANAGAILAAERLLAGLAPLKERLDGLYSTSVGRDFLEPSTASVIQARLGLGPEVKSLDLSSACLGFIDGLEAAAVKIEGGFSEYALVAAGENSRPLLENTLTRLLAPETTVKDFFRNFASLTLGSGGAAMIVGPASRHPTAPRLKAMVSRADASANDLCRGDFTGMETDSTALLEAGVALAADTFQEGARSFGWRADDFDLVVCHQVSEVNTRRFCQALGLKWERIVKTYPDFGNMGPVAVPFAFDLAWEQGRIKPGSRVALMGIGSGLCCAMMEVEIPQL